MIFTTEQKIANIQKLRPIDDIFFEVLARNPRVCEEMLRTILEDKELVVESVITQMSERNLYGRSVRLDALCTLGNGTRCNIEVQRSDNDDHLRRVRYNASSITVKESNTGDNFSEITELYVVYISEFDIFNDGLTTYHIDKVIRENGKVVDDGLHEIFVNTAVYDNTDIADLMQCFKSTEVNSLKFPRLSEEVTNLKTTEGGVRSMCKIMEDMFAEEKAKMEAEKEAALAEKDAERAKMEAEKDAEIARLKALLEKK